MFGSAARQQPPWIMGVLNVTPDSFSDGGRYADVCLWQERITQLIAEGVDVIDIGGESTRPGSAQVSADEQLRRVLEPVLFARSKGVLVSVDTTHFEVADKALFSGANYINDVSCLSDQRLAEVVAKHNAGLVIMHSRGAMSEMAGFSVMKQNAYNDVVSEVCDELQQACDRAKKAGVEATKIFVDPGLGFHKNAEHSYTVMQSLDQLQGLAAGVVLGASRKSFLASDVSGSPNERIGGSLAAVVMGYLQGVQAFRVHDVFATRQAIAVAQRCCNETVTHDVATRSRQGAHG